MVKIGLKYPVYALATETASAISYANGAVLGKGIKADIKINSNDVKLFADDGLAEIDRSFKDGSITVDTDDLTDAVKIALLGNVEGATVDASIGTKEISALGNVTPGYVGFGFYGKKIVAGVTRWRAIWLKKVQFTEPDDNNKTKGESPEFQTPTLEGAIMVAADGKWKEEGTFSTEANAKLWLEGKATIPVTASGGLTALALTGTGGTLSPAFGTAIRSYAFNGLTGTSFTVTPTAANHTISLYVDDVFVQTVVSGSASAAIAMASVGSKKVKLIAQEAGKTPQVTEIVAIKTA